MCAAADIGVYVCVSGLGADVWVCVYHWLISVHMSCM